MIDAGEEVGLLDLHYELMLTAFFLGVLRDDLERFAAGCSAEQLEAERRVDVEPVHRTRARS